MKTLLTLCILSAAWCNAAMTLRDPFYAASLSSGSTWVQPISTIVTDASATPTTTNLTLTGGANAFRVWTGETSYTEPGFDLYVRTNAGNVVTVRLYRWTARIIYAPPGSSISLGTVDGRTLQAAPIYVPAALPAPSGATGNANCDKAGPPLWTPQNAHITLPTDGSSFVVKSNTSESILFISEYDGTTWSYPRFLWVQTNYDITVQATYKRIALANYDGTVQSIVAPTGSTIGGTSNLMSWSLPTVTGTSRYVTTTNELIEAITNAVAGDEIVLADGTFAINTNVTQDTFAANKALGNKGMGGIIIRSSNGIPGNCIITGAVTNTGDWTLVMDSESKTSYVFNVCFNFSNQFAGFSVSGGRFVFQNVLAFGPCQGSYKLLEVKANANGPLMADMLWCTATNSNADCYSGTGDTTWNKSNKWRLIGCTGGTAGPTANSQPITTHTGLTNFLYGGYYYDGSNNISANAVASTDFTYLNFIRSDPGLRNGRIQNASLFACDCLNTTRLPNFDISSNGYCISSRLIITNLSSSSAMFRNVAGTFVGNRCLATTSGRGVHSSKESVRFVGNVFTGFNEGLRLADYSSGNKGSYLFVNNSFVSCATALGCNEATTGILTLLTNNATTGSTKGIDCSATSFTNLFEDYNCIDPNIDTDFVHAPNTTTNADAAINLGTLIPTPSGNCDGNGQTNILGYVGEIDTYGFVLYYAPTRMSRGAREIPAIYAGAVLYPDIW